MKRLTAILLTGLMLMAMLTTVASAAMYSGQYNNLNYITRVTVSTDKRYGTARITYEGSTLLHGEGTVYFVGKFNGISDYCDLNVPLGLFDASKTRDVLVKNDITRIEEDFYIGDVCIETMDELF